MPFLRDQQLLMKTDVEKRLDFAKFLSKLKKRWTIYREAEEKIIKIILKHKDSELDTYISHFKHMVDNMENHIEIKPDKHTKNPPPDGKCVYSFVGASIYTRNYTSNYELGLFFSFERNEIYDFNVFVKDSSSKHR